MTDFFSLSLHTYRGDQIRGQEELRADIIAGRSDLAAAENFLGERITRETEERRTTNNALRQDTGAELEALREETERRAQVTIRPTNSSCKRISCMV